MIGNRFSSAIMAFLICISTTAHDFKVGNIYYNILSESEKTVEVTYKDKYSWKYTDRYTGSITIPENVTFSGKNYSITKIGDYAFADCTDLTSLIIGNNVKEIGYCAILRCTGLNSLIVGNGVSYIGEKAFNGCSGLFSIIVEDGNPTYDSREKCNAIIETQTNTLIAGCRTTKIPTTIESIGATAFFECTTLTSLEIPSNITHIGSHAFKGCTSLTDIYIPNSVTSIAKYSFADCSSLSKIKLPDNLRIIEEQTFSRCSNLSKLIIPDSIRTIGDLAFAYCNKLDTLTIGKSVTNIGSAAFSGCKRLKTIINFSDLVLKKGSTDYGEVAYNADKIINADGHVDQYYFKETEKYISLIAYLGNDNELLLPNAYDQKKYTIGDYAFYNLPNIIAVTIPDSVTSIGEKAFYGCSKLESITMGKTVTTIGCSAFEGTAWHEQQPDGEIYLNTVLYEYKGIMPPNTSIEIKDGTTSVSGNAFINCTGLNSITIPKSITHIGDNAFYGCYNLKNIVNFSTIDIKKKSTDNGYIAYYADEVLNADGRIDNFIFGITDGEYKIIAYWGNDENIILPDKYKGNLYSIGDEVFMGKTEIISVTFPNNVTSIGEKAFYGCNKLESITMGKNITTIGCSAFEGTAWHEQQPDGEIYLNTVLYEYKGIMPPNTSIEIKDGTTSVSGNAFINCTGLNSITIPKSITHIGDNAFYGCYNLKNIVNFSTIDLKKKSTDNGYIAYYADEVLNVDGRIDNFIFGITDGEYNIIAYWGNDENIILPDKYKGNSYGIGDGVFEENKKIQSIIIPSSVTRIGNSSFLSCSSLTAVTLPHSVVDIGDWAFGDCTNLNYINIPNGVKSIGRHAFYGCKNLNSITIPMSVTNIGTGAFSYCPSLNSINVDDCNVVYDSRDNCNAIIESKADRLIAGCCSTIIPHDIIFIGEHAFSGCTELNAISLPCNITYIEADAFAGCERLTYMSIPNSVKNIGDFAFSSCSSLTSVTIPNSVTSIGEYTFNGCLSISSITLGTNLRAIGDFAFANCPEITLLSSLSSNAPVCNTNTFDSNIYDHAQLFVPEDYHEVYKQTTPWCYFKIESLTASISDIETETNNDRNIIYDLNGVSYKRKKLSKNGLYIYNGRKTLITF